jgi:hypothetical protein
MFAALGYNPTLLTGAKDVVRSREAALGDLICDAMRW